MIVVNCSALLSLTMYIYIFFYFGPFSRKWKFQLFTMVNIPFHRSGLARVRYHHVSLDWRQKHRLCFRCNLKGCRNRLWRRPFVALRWSMCPPPSRVRSRFHLFSSNGLWCAHLHGRDNKVNNRCYDVNVFSLNDFEWFCNGKFVSLWYLHLQNLPSLCSKLEISLFIRMCSKLEMTLFYSL